MSSVIIYLQPFLEFKKDNAIKQCFHAVGLWMINDLKDYSKQRAGVIAAQILDCKDRKYAKLVETKIGDVVADTGLNKFTQQIYGYVRQHMGPENIKPRGRTRSRAESEAPVDEDGLLLPPQAR